MANKIKWITDNKPLGNVISEHTGYVIFKGDKLTLMRIREFKKNWFTLPENFYPRKENGLPQHTRTLNKAKKLCEDIFKEFINEMNK